MLLVAPALAASALGGPPAPADVPGKDAVVKANNRFALDLYGRVRGQEGNLFFSPSSISAALAMTYAGARGPTAEQMATVLSVPPEQEWLHSAYASFLQDLKNQGEPPGCKLTLANALWGQKGHGFQPGFLKVLKNSYHSDLHEVDFRQGPDEARKSINAWVEEETRQKIHEMVKPGQLDAQTLLVLTNAVYFKGEWESPFKKDDTREGAFWVRPKHQVSVPLMRQAGKFPYLDEKGFQALELSYAGGGLRLVVLLPKKADGLAELEKRLTPANLEEWLGKLRPEKVTLSLPQFRTTAELQLKSVLADMGMPLAFRPGEADFSGMTTRGSELALSAVAHKAYVEVNEAGTEAAAATAIKGRSLFPPRVPEFRADHPFVFAIRDGRSGCLLFLGRLSDPRP
jgi:serpin B